MQKKKILVVEDQENLLRLFNILLSSHGYDVCEDNDGEAALNAIEIDRPDLVLLDINLPGINGFEVCERIKSQENTHEIPVVAITARVAKADLLRLDEVGADWYIPKPFKSVVLIETVQRFLKNEKP